MIRIKVSIYVREILHVYCFLISLVQLFDSRKLNSCTLYLDRLIYLAMLVLLRTLMRVLQRIMSQLYRIDSQQIHYWETNGLNSGFVIKPNVI